MKLYSKYLMVLVLIIHVTSFAGLESIEKALLCFGAGIGYAGNEFWRGGNCLKQGAAIAVGAVGYWFFTHNKRANFMLKNTRQVIAEKYPFLLGGCVIGIGLHQLKKMILDV